MSVILEARALSKRFGGVTAVEDLSFGVETGELLGLIGPNGAGKTTVFNLITGVHRPSAGEVVHRGTRLSGRDPAAIARRGVARTFQNIRLFPSLSVLEHILVAQACRERNRFARYWPFLTAGERARRSEALALLAEVGLETRSDEQAVHLPYGAQRRLEIARALATSPDLLLLDEPAAGLNDTETRELRGLLERLQRQGHTIVLVEHDMALVMKVCSRIIVLNFGRLIASGPPAQVRANRQVIDAYLGVAG